MNAKLKNRRTPLGANEAGQGLELVNSSKKLIIRLLKVELYRTARCRALPAQPENLIKCKEKKRVDQWLLLNNTP